MNRLQQEKLHPVQMLQRVSDFMHKVEALAQELGLPIDAFQADHLALRINDWEVASLAHQAWKDYGRTISEANINGRPIVVMLLENPIKYKNWNIECLELPYPAKPYPNQDWEHVEFVIPSDALVAEDYLAELCQRFCGLAGALDNQGYKVKLSSPKGEGERLANPTVAIKKQGVCIKLHPHPLKAVVESEQGL
ncbi:VOC family protein [Vibrio gallicus]|uniref:VOC family protein n=1 Tax=Vibrio gallicus TaxID=190897 RepID=UPI0021C36189|nr:VOC family protein [Vibrio gallicus]